MYTYSYIYIYTYTHTYIGATSRGQGRDLADVWRFTRFRRLAAGLSVGERMVRPDWRACTVMLRFSRDPNSPMSIWSCNLFAEA